MGKNSSNSIISFITGLVLGGIFGVLFAPDRGNNTRDRLTYRLNKYKLRIQEILDDVLDEKEDLAAATATSTMSLSTLRYTWSTFGTFVSSIY